MTHNSVFVKASLGTLLLLASLFQGCHSGGQKEKDLTRMHLGQLYLKDQPYQQLYVEIDTLEGTKIPPGLIEEIRDFLSQYCNKPGGIKIVQDAPVSFEEELSIGLMSILCMDGPVDSQDEQTAYLHVFFYDTEIENVLSFTENPYVCASCPTTVFINLDYCWIAHDSMTTHFIRHELGHILGLCWNTDHGNKHHCRKNRCLMRPSPGILGELATLFQLPMKECDLCTKCIEDLTYAKSQDSFEHYSFKGPFLVKNQDEEVKISIPYFRATVPKEAVDSLNWKTLLSDTKTDIKSKIEKFVDTIKSKDREIVLSGKYEPQRN